MSESNVPLTKLYMIYPPCLLSLRLLRVVPIYTSFNSLTGVFSLNLLQPLPVIIQALQTFKLSEKVAFLDNNDLLVESGTEDRSALASCAELGLLMTAMVCLACTFHTMSNYCTCELLRDSFFQIKTIN